MRNLEHELRLDALHARLSCNSIIAQIESGVPSKEALAKLAGDVWVIEQAARRMSDALAVLKEHESIPNHPPIQQLGA